MPINEIEVHPFLHIGEAIPASRMIVGTFPIYSLTNPRTQRKNTLKQERNDISFFYGSRSNYFWNWYQKYSDTEVNIKCPKSIIDSITNNAIAISDVIKQCTRVEESFEDKNLQQKQWNLQLVKVIESRIEKIICTSKSQSGAMGWLIDKILIPAGFLVDQQSSIALQESILTPIQGSNLTTKNVALVLKKGNKKISIVSLPSPGSPFRKLINFGYVKGIHQTNTYLNSYLSSAWGWFLNLNLDE